MVEIADILTISSSIVISLLLSIGSIFGWLGSRINLKLDDMAKQLEKNNSELHARISKIDSRIVRLETIVSNDNELRINEARTYKGRRQKEKPIQM